MGKTIIQTIGPLYGEVVNGTVFGRPNGSVFVPASNTITQSLAEGMRYVKNEGSALTICTVNGSVPYPQSASNRIISVAQSQDIQNYIGLELATDAEFTDVIGSFNFSAGQFNTVGRAFFGTETITAGTTYYLRSVLYSATGVPVSVSEVINLEGYA